MSIRRILALTVVAFLTAHKWSDWKRTAQITTLPILVVVYRQVSLLTLLVNALVLPAQSG